MYYNPDQLTLFKELKLDPPVSLESQVLFYLPTEIKQDLIKSIKLQNLTLKGFFNNAVKDFLDGLTKKEVKKEPVKTGRGNISKEPEEVAKKLLREVFPGGIKAITLARVIGNGFTQAQAMRVLDNLSGNTDGRAYSFLVFYDEDEGVYSIYKDDVLGIEYGEKK